MTMARTVNCVLLGREAEGLDIPPYPGELGTAHLRAASPRRPGSSGSPTRPCSSTRIRLSPVDPRRASLPGGEMEKFFFGGGSDAPDGYVPPESVNR